MSFNEIPRLDGLAGLNRLRYLDLGYNVIEGVQRHLRNSHHTAKSSHIPDDTTTTIITPAKKKTAADINDIVATRCTAPGPSLNIPMTSARPVRAPAETTRDAFSGKFSSVAAGAGTAAAPDVQTAILLPSLTRLDLNDNILHDLDDLKVRGAALLTRVWSSFSNHCDFRRS